MSTHTINREVFEFTYYSENVAGKMQHQLVHYYAYEFNEILQRLLQKHFDENDYYGCDKIEIDLGDIAPNAFEEGDLFHVFENALDEKLYAIKKQDTAKRRKEEVALDVVERFLVTGDMPWWIDKTDVRALHDFIELLLLRSPGKLMEVIKKDSGSAGVKIQRLLDQYKGAKQKDSVMTNLLALFQEEGAQLIKVAHRDKLIDNEDLPPAVKLFNAEAPLWLQLQALATVDIKALKKLIKRSAVSVAASGKDAIVEALLKNRSRLLQLNVLDAFFYKEVYKDVARLLLKSHLHHGDHIHLQGYFGRLSYYRLQLLSSLVNDTTDAAIDAVHFRQFSNSQEENTAPGNEAAPGVSSAKPGSSIDAPILTANAGDASAFSEAANKERSIENEKGAGEKSAKSIEELAGANRWKFIESILLKLKLDKRYANLFDSYTDEAVFSLHQTFIRSDVKVLHARKGVDMIIKHPYFFRFHLLEAVINGSYQSGAENNDALPVENQQQNEERAGLVQAVAGLLEEIKKQSHQRMNQLGENELAILKNILEKRSVDTVAEKSLLKKILHHLPDRALNVLHFFTQLKEEVVTKFIVAENPVPASTSQRENEANRLDDLYTDEQKNSDAGRKVYINNAGLCLIAQYLPSFFKNLHLLEDKKFKSIAHATRALYILEYLAEGTKKYPEYVLQFNKLLTGFNVHDPLLTRPRLLKKEKTEADALLAAVIEHWKALRQTSPAGLRNSFLQREGILTESERSWTLQVERKGHDILLDSIPWGFKMIKFPWMQKHIVVEW